jgi:hypothetical protein
LDHLSLWLRFKHPLPYTRRPKLFKFEANWNLDEECKLIIKDSLRIGGVPDKPLGNVLLNLESCNLALTKWSNLKYGAGGCNIKQLAAQLERQQQNEHPGNVEAIRGLQVEIHRLLKMEDLMWKQRAKRNWYVHGDRNTKYFHAWANFRRRMNLIEKVTDEGGRQWQHQVDLEKVFVQHFQLLYSSSGSRGIEDCLSAVISRVT